MIIRVILGILFGGTAGFLINDEIVETFKKKGYRVTKQRLIILDALRNTTTHPTAEEIYELVKLQNPNISLGTVYRTLGALEELGLLQKISCGESYSRYDANVEKHYHAICLECDRVLDVSGNLLDDLEERFFVETGFTITEHRLELCGYCKDCKLKREMEDKS